MCSAVSFQAANETISSLQAKVAELTEEVASQSGQRVSAERIADALRQELMTLSAAVRADESNAAQKQLSAQVSSFSYVAAGGFLSATKS
jgi:FtsZ-binding cell division protein ZapB